MGECVLCHESTGRIHDSHRPCCKSCEKDAPMVIQAPGLFLEPSPVQHVAIAVIREVDG